MAPTALEGGLVISFEVGEGRIEHFPPRYDDDVDGGSHLVTPEDLAGQSLGAVAINRRADLPRRRHAEPRSLAAVR